MFEIKLEIYINLKKKCKELGRAHAESCLQFKLHFPDKEELSHCRLFLFFLYPFGNFK